MSNVITGSSSVATKWVPAESAGTVYSPVHGEASGGPTKSALSSGRDGQLTFEVCDDGRGFDAANTSLGSGMQNMADRLAALGGSIEVRSHPGSGTTVLGRIPVAL